jgi:hypothetical protein
MSASRAIAGLLLASAAQAHTLSSEEVIASLATPTARVAAGVERAERDPRNPRVLVVRVGPGWFAMTPAARAGMAADWWAGWRRAVPQGVVAVLDRGTDRAVVRFGRAGAVVDVRDRPG